MVRDIYKIIDLNSSSFPEFFLKTIGHDGKLPYRIKCLLFGIVPWIIGLIICLFSGSLEDFVIQYGFLTSCIVVGITLWALVRFFKKIDDTFMRLDLFGVAPVDFSSG